MSAPEPSAPASEQPGRLEAAAAFVDKAENWLTRAVALVLGLASVALGAFVFLDSLGVLETEGSVFYAPRWVVGAVGLLFVIAGLYMVTYATIGFKMLKRVTRGWILRAPIIAISFVPLVISGVLILTALGQMEMEEVNAPPWVLICAGVVFALMGGCFIVWAVTTTDPDVRGIPAPPPSTTRAALPIRIVRSAFVIVFVALIAAMLTWAALYAKPDDISGSTSLNFFGFSMTWSEENRLAEFKFGFGAVALLGWFLTIAALVQGWRDVFSRGRT